MSAEIALGGKASRLKWNDPQGAGGLDLSGVLAGHQRSGPWTLRALADDLHTWAERFAARFDLQIPRLVLRLDRLHPRKGGHYLGSCNEFGIAGEIAINLRHVAADNYWHTLGVLLHEQLHSWQYMHGKPGRHNYHNIQYQAKAKVLGLVVDGKGRTQFAPHSPFMDMLQEFGVAVPDLPEPHPFPRGESTLKLWVCRCPEPVRLRVGRETINALCLDCKSKFVRVP